MQTFVRLGGIYIRLFNGNEFQRYSYARERDALRSASSLGSWSVQAAGIEQWTNRKSRRSRSPPQFITTKFQHAMFLSLRTCFNSNKSIANIVADGYAQWRNSCRGIGYSMSCSVTMVASCPACLPTVARPSTAQQGGTRLR